MKWSVLQFPGSNCDQDCVHVLGQVLKQEVVSVWHKKDSLPETDVVVVPGGFSYGDYLRCGAIARFSPIMKAVRDHAEAGGTVIGICNGFQILCEARFLPGALIRNRDLSFLCEQVQLRVETPGTRFTSTYSTGQVLNIPIAHGEGNYIADAATLHSLEVNQQILFRYCDSLGRTTPESNPNGSALHIAGICNRRGNVLGLMPHPERASEAALGSVAGLGIFQAILESQPIQPAA
jgi:phosphoribosylformylglycinamidine synthase subunit PurQ / glutaminase